MRFTVIAVTALVITLLSLTATAEAPQIQKPSSEADIKAALMGGVPAGRWKEGLLFEGISPQPWLKSAANWFPGTEEVQPNEMGYGFLASLSIPDALSARHIDRHAKPENIGAR